MAAKQIPILRNKFGRFGDPPSALKAGVARYNYDVETIRPSVSDVPPTQPYVGFS
jgi:hypothetical protein